MRLHGVKKSSIPKIKFANKSIDALHLSNILKHNPSKLIFPILSKKKSHHITFPILPQLFPKF